MSQSPHSLPWHVRPPNDGLHRESLVTGWVAEGALDDCVEVESVRATVVELVLKVGSEVRLVEELGLMVLHAPKAR
jgi:hypothetical protein